MEFGNWIIVDNVIEWNNSNRGDKGYYIDSRGLLSLENDVYSWMVHLARKMWLFEKDLLDFNNAFIYLAGQNSIKFDDKTFNKSLVYQKKIIERRNTRSTEVTINQ